MILLLVGIAAAGTCAQSTPPADPGIVLEASIPSNQREFHIGEIIPLQLSFSSIIKDRYQINMAQYDRSGRMNYEHFIISPAEGSSNLCLVVSRPERPAGIETGVVLFSDDVLADLAALRAQGLDMDEQPLREGEVVWWSGAPLGGVPTQFRLRDPDGNSFLVVAAP